MIRAGKRTLPFVAALVAGLWAGPAGAACTALVGKKIQAKSNPKFQVQAKDVNISPAAVNPIADGVTVTITVNAGTVTYTMPAGSLWTGDASSGWKYKNSSAPSGGQVKIGQIKAGKLKVLAFGLGDTGSFPLTVTTDVDAVVASGTTSYAMRFLLSDAKKNDGTQYLNKNPSLASGSCPCADCCSAGFTRIKTVNGVPSSSVVGHVLDDSGANLLNLTSGGLYFGGAGVGVPLPSQVPDTLPDANGFAGTYTKITGCAGGNFTISPAALADVSGSVHPARHCSVAGVPNGVYTGKDGCLFGPPLAIPNTASPATSTCVVNRVSTNAAGTGKCDGTTSLSLPLASDIYLTGPTDGLVPCPLCNGAGPTCSAGPNSGQPCVPEDSASISAANPTSHDCPPASAAFVGTLPIGFNLSAGSQTKTSVDFSAQPFVFFGFCGQQFSPSFEGPPAHACTADSQCTVSPNTKCRQRTSGAFGQGPARTITETGAAPGCLTDGAPHALTLVSVFGIPPAFNATVDSAGDLPGPGATSLPGTTQLIP